MSGVKRPIEVMKKAAQRSLSSFVRRSGTPAGRAIFVLTISLSLLIQTACSRSRPTYPHAAAPRAQAEAGHIIRSASLDDLQVLLERTGATARTIHARSGLFEVFGIERERLVAELPASATYVEANGFLASLIPDERSSSSPEVESFVSECRFHSQVPQAQIGISSIAAGTPQSVSPFSLELSTNQVTLGAMLVFDSKRSRPHLQNPGDLDVWWLIRSPVHADQVTRPLHQNELEFRASTVGLYDITLVVRDSRGVCAQTSLSFTVTAKPEPLKLAPEPRFDATELKRFTHLETIGAPEAWRRSEGRSVTIAIIDTGVNYNHPALAANIAVNGAEIPGNGLDDDSNGFIDDDRGWDFSKGDNRPFDDSGHGTHVAGLAAATTMGVAPQARILPVKVLRGDGGGDVASIAAGIYYAVDSGARVINASLGSLKSEFRLLQAAIDYASANGAVFVAAAGNGDPLTREGINLDVTPIYPAALLGDGLISVAAVNEGRLTAYSNFGTESVDVAAPGGDPLRQLILSTAPPNAGGRGYVGRSGTSMAAPLVAGAAALILDRNPTLTPVAVRQILIEAGDPVLRLRGLVRSARILDVERALEKAEERVYATPSKHVDPPQPPPKETNSGTTRAPNETSIQTPDQT